jgi:hypothetical protein
MATGKTTVAGAPEVGAQPKARAVRTRQVAKGDIPPTATPAGIEGFVVHAAVDGAQESKLGALRDVIHGMPVDDSLALLKALLKEQRMAKGDRLPNPDEELVKDWREWRLSLSQPDAAPQLRAPEIPPAGRVAQVAGLGQGNRAEGGDPFRGPRCGGQGRDDQAFHGAPESAGRARRGAGKAERDRAWPVVFPALRQHLPTNGEIVLFDRSWYNRAGVERVMGFCSEAGVCEFVRQAPEFERMLVRNGTHVIKFWFSVSREEQRRRFGERKVHPLKQWKLSPIDVASLDKWDDYTKAKEAMFFHTDTADAPWTVIKSNCKKRARLNAMRYILHKLPYTNKDTARIGNLDPLIVGRANVVYERGEHQGVPIL